MISGWFPTPILPMFQAVPRDGLVGLREAQRILPLRTASLNTSKGDGDTTLQELGEQLTRGGLNLPWRDADHPAGAAQCDSNSA